MAPTQCTVNGCNNPPMARGWCQRHYKSWWLHGDPLAAKRRATGTLWERYWPCVVEGPNGCWLWQGAANQYGYGHIGYQYRLLAVHRLSYRWFVGPIPSWLQIDHLCHNRACVNPAHLEAVTSTVNCQRGYKAKPTPTDWTPKDGATHCPHGHPWTPENTIIRRWEQYQKRRCRTCQNERVADWRRRQANAP